MDYNANLIQLYSDDARTEAAYPICHEKGLFNDEGKEALSALRDNLQEQIADLVLESTTGTSNLEVVNARADVTGKVHKVLKDRLDYEFNKLAEMIDAKFDRYFELVP